jgi:hypothetical protein
MKKYCNDCGKMKSTVDFHASGWTRDGLQVYCIPCRRKRNKKYTVEVAERRRKSKYGISIEQYEKMKGDYCPICEVEFGTGTAKPGIDHNHTTGKVRDIICQNCNVMLGMARDDPGILESGAMYLKKHDCPNAGKHSTVERCADCGYSANDEEEEREDWDGDTPEVASRL